MIQCGLRYCGSSLGSLTRELCNLPADSLVNVIPQVDNEVQISHFRNQVINIEVAWIQDMGGRQSFQAHNTT